MSRRFADRAPLLNAAQWLSGTCSVRMCRAQTSLRMASAVAAALVLAACGSSPASRPDGQAASASSSAAAKAPQPRTGRSEIPERNLADTTPLPSEAVQRFEAAVVHMNAGDLAAAETQFKALAAAFPEYSGALLNLGILQARAGRLEEAEQTIKSAIARNSDNAPAFNQLGIVYRKLGRFDDAEEAYQRAIRIDPAYANAHLNLGVLCDLYLQQPERALQAYERYLDLASTPDARVSAWVNELKRRIGDEPRAARMD